MKKLLDDFISLDSNNMLHGANLVIGESTITRDFITNFLLIKYCSQKTACGKCENCELISEQNYHKILFFEASDSTVDSVRAINNFLNIKTDYKKYIIIFEVGLLNKFAQNALLKNLEESKDNIFLLTCSEKNLDSVLATVNSRCVKYKVAQQQNENKELISSIAADLTKLLQEKTSVCSLANEYMTYEPELIIDALLIVSGKRQVPYSCIEKLLELQKLWFESKNLNKTLFLENAFMACL